MTPRYAKLKGRADSREVIGWENIELISDRPFETMLAEFTMLKAEFPNRILIASIMEVSLVLVAPLPVLQRSDCCSVHCQAAPGYLLS